MNNIVKKKKPFYVHEAMVLAALFWVLIGYILYPALKTVSVSITGEGAVSFAHYIDLFTSASSLRALKNSIVLGLLTVIVCGVIGTTLAFFVNYFEFKYKRFFDKLMLMPMMLPGLIIVFSFVQLYGESGLVTKTLELLFKLEKAPYEFSGLGGILFVHAYTQYVYFYISVSVAIKHIDYSVIESARNLGASKLKIFKSIIIPFLAPALIASSIITFMSGIGSFSAPSIIGGSYKVMTTQILLSKANNFMSVAAAQVVILTCVSMLYLFVFRLYEKKKQFTSSVKGVPIKPVKIESKAFRAILAFISLALVAMILLPVITIIVLSFVKPGTWMIDIYPKEFSLDNYINIFTKSRSSAPFINSAAMALQAAFLCLIVAVPCSYVIIKTKFKLKWLVEFLAMLPWTMPSSAIAINIINAYNTPGIFSFNSVLVGTYILLPLAYFVSSIPLMVRTANISLQNMNDTYIEASKSLGASKGQTFGKVMIPIISPGIIAGFLLVFIRSVGEYTMSIFLYTVSNKPISIAMVNGIFEYDIGLAMAYGALIIVITSVLSIVISKLLPNRMRGLK